MRETFEKLYAANDVTFVVQPRRNLMRTLVASALLLGLAVVLLVAGCGPV